VDCKKTICQNITIIIIIIIIIMITTIMLFIVRQFNSSLSVPKVKNIA